MDALGWLRLQAEWGADEALEDRPQDRRAAPARAMLPNLPMAQRGTPLPPPPSMGGVARAQALAAAAPTQAALREAVAGFDACALRATATNLVFADGNQASRLVLVADVPGAAEDRAGVPFAGPSAQFLDRMFASAGLDRSAAFAMSLLPWRPPGDRKPADAEIQLCMPFLLRHLALMRPRRAVLFGGLAAKSLLPGDTRRARSGWQAMHVPGLAEPVPTLVLSALSHIQTTAAAKRDAWANLLLLRRALDADRVDHD